MHSIPQKKLLLSFFCLNQDFRILGLVGLKAKTYAFILVFNPENTYVFSYMLTLQSLFGLVCILLIAYAFSEEKKAISFKPIIIAVLIHIALAVIFLKLPMFQDFFLLLNKVVLALETSFTATVVGLIIK